MAYIYALLSEDGLPLYVGFTDCLKHREVQHRNGQIKYQVHGVSKKLCGSWKIPLNMRWTIEVIEECAKEAARDRERYWISELDPPYNLNRRIFS